MAFNFNGSTPKKILYNGLNVAKLIYNGVVVWMSKVLATIEGILPLTLTNSTGDDLVDYKIYGNTEEVLPRGYTQVEYLESTGTQYIDIGRKMYNNSELELFFSFDEMQQDCSIFGSRTSSTTNNFEIASTATGYPIYLDFGNYSTSRATYNSAAINTEYICTISKSLRAIYDENHTLLARNTTLISTDNTTPSNARIFDTVNGFSANKLKGKVYYCKIWEEGVLIREMIPCKNPSNVAGMYDTVNGVFYTNAGTGTFNTGSVVSKKSVGDLVTDTSDINYGKYKIPVLTNSHTANIYLNKPLRRVSKLPYGYTELQHIRGTGTQWIDTGFKPTGNTKVKIKVQLPTQLNVQQGIFGARPGDTGHFTVFTGNRGDALQVDYNTVESLGGYSAPISNFNAVNVNEIEMSNKLIINDVLVREVNKISFQSSVNLYLFTNNNNGTPQLIMKGMIWYCKTWDNDVLVRNFIPCKNPSNVIGMYDTVNDVFYSNAGTDSFIAGAEVETVYYTDYLDYENQKVVRNVDDNGEGLDTPVEESVVLPAVATDEGTVTVDVDTEIAPSYAEVVYYKNDV